MSINFLYCCIKIYWPALHFEWSFTLTQSYNIIHLSLGNLVPLVMQSFQILTFIIFHYQMFSNCTYCYYHWFYLKKIFWVMDTNFQKFKFPLESSNFITHNKCWPLFPLRWQIYFIHVWDKPAKYHTSLKNCRLSISNCFK